MAKMIKRVYGLAGIGCYMANWNADFTGRPKTTSDGSIFGSDKAFKYSIKRYWVNQGEKILYFKSYIITDKKGKSEEKEKLQPKELSQRYEEIFETELLASTKSSEVLGNLFSALDVLNFGATFAVGKQNISLTGAVQVGQGMNKFEDSNIEVQDILSPFRNPKKEDADASSLGKKIVCDEAHYVYPFSINPNNYDEYIPMLDGFEGYTEEAYERFKEGVLLGATALNTNSKAGCENEMALFVTCKEGDNLYLPHLDGYVSVFKENKEDKIIYDFTILETFLAELKEHIERVEIYYNPYKVDVKLDSNWFAKSHIYTREAL